MGPRNAPDRRLRWPVRHIPPIRQWVCSSLVAAGAAPSVIKLVSAGPFELPTLCILYQLSGSVTVVLDGQLEFIGNEHLVEVLPCCVAYR